jgi:pimeloyl-ACP methyl ester carboxylesterase
MALAGEQTHTVQLDIRYARSGGAAIAYQVVGNGPTDLVFVPEYMSNLVYGWESPRWRDFYERLASFSRLILFDKRGTGLSDYSGGFPTLETRMEDVRAVLDAVDSGKTVLLGAHEGCAMACLFAATYPERTTALVLFQPASKGAGDPDEAVVTEEEWGRDLAEVRERWGTQEFSDEMLAEIAPSLAANEDDRAWFANWVRVGASPAAAYALNRIYAETDLRDVLPAIRVPTLLLYRGSMEKPARMVQERIPDAQLVRIPGDEFWGIFLSPEIPTEIERFLSGAKEAAEPDRVLLTVLFTDLVSATARAVELGDSAWRDLLARHHEIIRREITLYLGAKSTRPATDSSRLSTARRAPSAAPTRFAAGCAISSSTSGWACIRASANSSAISPPGSPSTPAHASQPQPTAAKSSCRAPSRILSAALGSLSTIAACTSSRAYRTSGACTRSRVSDRGRHKFCLSLFTEIATGGRVVSRCVLLSLPTCPVKPGRTPCRADAGAPNAAGQRRARPRRPQRRRGRCRGSDRHRG